MAIRLAVANLKGGVGKSTATLFLAEALALFHDQRVLVVDLDPQSNTSFMLLSRDGLDQAEKAGRTLPQFLVDLEGSAKVKQPIHAYICSNVSDVSDLKGRPGTVDVLPSVPKLWFVETLVEKKSYMQNVDPGAELRLTLGRYLDPVDHLYDLIIFDCPPGFSALTRAGLLSADVVLSPTIADAVSMRSLADFVKLGLQGMLHKDVPHFVVISKYLPKTTDPNEVMRLRKSYRVLEPPISFSVQMTRATERIRPNSMRSFKEKYGRLEGDVRAVAEKFYRSALSKGGRR